MNDTPRTDAVQDELINQDTYTSWLEMSRTARQLERELNAANEQIKRLEEAGDAMFIRSTRVGREIWTKAKEAKP